MLFGTKRVPLYPDHLKWSTGLKKKILLLQNPASIKHWWHTCQKYQDIVLLPASICGILVSSVARQPLAASQTGGSKKQQSRDERSQRDVPVRQYRHSPTHRQLCAQISECVSCDCKRCQLTQKLCCFAVRIPARAFVVARAGVTRVLVASTAMQSAAEQWEGVPPLVYALKNE